MLHRVNRILTRAVLILLSIVLITTSVVSSIFAKYTQTRSINIPLGFKPAYVDINWESLSDEGFMRSQWWTDIGQAKNDYKSKFTVKATETELTSEPKDKGADRSYFSTKMYEITSYTKYEYTFEAKNDRAGGYAGVIFAYDIKNYFPYFAYGEFDNRSVEGGNHICYRKGHSNKDGDDYIVNKDEIFAKEVNETADGYGQYKVIYEGLKVKFCYLNTSGKYVQLGSTIELPAGSKVCVGVFSDSGSIAENKNCTVSLKNCVLTAKNYETVDYLVGENISLVKEFTLKVATFNIRKALHESPPYTSYGNIVAAIKESGADIIFLQDVEYRTELSGHRDQVALIADAAGYDHYWTFKAIQYDHLVYENGEKAGSGVAIISKYPVGSIDIFSFSSNTGENKILARMGTTVNNEVIQLFVTQLSYGASSDVRDQQFAEVANTIANYKNVILGGDFDTYHLEDFDPIVEKGFLLVNKPDDPVGTYGEYPLDNIVHSKIFTSSGRGVIENASDHRLLYATLTYSEARLPMMSK